MITVKLGFQHKTTKNNDKNDNMRKTLKLDAKK